MAAGDFIHKQLISAASKDALSSMGIGAGIGAGVGAANSLITGNDTLLGGATSGAIMGAGAGAAYRYAGAKYGSGLMAAAKEGADTGKFNTTFFTRATKDDFNMGFMGSADDAGHMKPFMDAAGMAKGKAAAAGGSMPQAGSVQSRNITKEANDMVNEGNAKDAIDATKKIRAEQAAAKNAYQSAPMIKGNVNTGGRGYAGKAAGRSAKAAKLNSAESVLANRKPTVGMEDYEDKGFMGNVPQHQLQYLNNQYAPKLNNEELRKGVAAKNASKIQKPGYTSQQEINSTWDNQAYKKEAQMDAMWDSIGL